MDVGKWVKGHFVDCSEQYCPVCKVGVADDEHHFLFQCPAYDSIWAQYDATFGGPVPTVSVFFALHDPTAISRFLRECFAVQRLCAFLNMN